MIPLYMVVMMLHIQNTYVGLILPFLVSAFGIFQMRQYLTTFPLSSLTQPVSTGWGVRHLRQDVLPNCKPVIATLSILAFRGQWTICSGPAVSQSEKMKTIRNTSRPSLRNAPPMRAMMAAALLASLPMFILFMSLTKYFIGGSSVYESRKG